MELMGIVVTIVLTVVVIAGISFFLSATSQPKGSDLEFLQSSVPEERLVDYRVCNAIIKNAEPKLFVDLAMLATGIDDVAGLTLKLMKKMAGGLWVGGRAFLTTHRVVFMPNALNRAVQDGLAVVAVRLEDVTGVRERFGFVTRILDIETRAGALTIRCLRASQFGSAIEAERQRAT
jgi:hypothetical protein